MCGRFALHASAQELEEHFAVNVPGVYVARYNIAPSSPLMSITPSGLTFFSWGLVPGWMKEVKPGRAMINARAETIAEKPSFRNAYKRRRCLIPASGFYEWKAEKAGKQPYYFHLVQPVFSFAGIWEHWQDGAGNELQSCAILTTEAVGNMTEVHHRMPVVIRPENYALWLDHTSEDTAQAQDCIAELDCDFQFHAVGKAVNSASNDRQELIKPMDN